MEGDPLSPNPEGTASDKLEAPSQLPKRAHSKRSKQSHVAGEDNRTSQAAPRGTRAVLGRSMRLANKEDHASNEQSELASEDASPSRLPDEGASPKRPRKKKGASAPTDPEGSIPVSEGSALTHNHTDESQEAPKHDSVLGENTLLRPSKADPKGHLPVKLKGVAQADSAALHSTEKRGTANENVVQFFQHLMSRDSKPAVPALIESPNSPSFDGISEEEPKQSGPIDVYTAIKALKAWEAGHRTSFSMSALLPWSVDAEKLKGLSGVPPHFTTVSETADPRPLKMLHRSLSEMGWRSSLRSVVAQTKSQLQAADSGYEMLQIIDEDSRRSTHDVTPHAHHKSLQQCTALVEFEHEEIMVDEGHHADIVKAKVVRFGDLESMFVCAWRITTTNLPEDQRHLLRTTSGFVEFVPGAAEASISLPIVRDPTWNRESFYVVQLAMLGRNTGEPSTVTLGRACRMSVHILNTERFPSNVPQDAPMKQLIWGFLKHNCAELPRQACQGAALKMFMMLPVLFGSECQRVLLDCSVKSGTDCHFYGVRFDNASSTNIWPLLVPAVIQLLCFGATYWASRTFRRLRLSGQAIRKLRVNLFATLLDLSFDSAQVFDKGDLIKIIDWHSESAVNHLWLGAFEALGLMAEMLAELIIVKNVAAQLLRSDDFQAAALLAFVLPLMFILTVVTSLLSEGRIYEHHTRAAGYEKNLFTFIETGGFNQPLIHMLRQVEPMVACAQKIHTAVNKARIIAHDFLAETVWCLSWSFQAIQLLVLITAGRSTRLEILTIGSYALLNKVVSDFGKALLSALDLSMQFSQGATSLTELTILLNKETLHRVHFDFIHLMHAESEGGMTAHSSVVYGYSNSMGSLAPPAGAGAARASQAARHRGGSVRRSVPGGLARDFPTINLYDVAYAYPAGFDGPGKLSLPGICGDLQFGHVCCIHREAKCDWKEVGLSTLFRMLAGQMIPDRGIVDIPGKTRVVYIPQTPMVFDGTLMYNLLYCMLTEDEETLQAAKEVAWTACAAIGMSDDLIGKEDFDIGEGGDRMKYSDRVCTTIVRSLLFDVDVLLLSPILDAVGEDHAKRIIKFLHLFVHHRALPGSGAFDLPWHLRPPKLVIYSTKIKKLAEKASKIEFRKVNDFSKPPLMSGPSSTAPPHEFHLRVPTPPVAPAVVGPAKE